jgi:hypothetical protein
MFITFSKGSCTFKVTKAESRLYPEFLGMIDGEE